ncbi:MAG TPA: hypothetical protein VND93_27660, partial [Myxococcales bacterium]|nr:hypothetical protein [Myxococcales bacterium]
MIRRRWILLVAMAAVAGALANLPGGPPPYVEDFESGLTGWGQNVDPVSANRLYLTTAGESWGGTGALAVEAGGNASPNAALMVNLGGTSGLDVRFFLSVPEATKLALAPGGTIRLLRGDGQLPPGVVTMDLVRDATGYLFLSTTVSSVTVTPVTSTTTLLAGTYHFVELSIDPSGQVSVFIDDPRIPRQQFTAASPAIYNLEVGIAGLVTSTGPVRLLYDDLVISTARVGMSDTRQYLANEYESPGTSIIEYPAGKSGGVYAVGSPPPSVSTQGSPGPVHRGARALAVVDQDGTSTTQGGVSFGFLDQDAGPRAVYRRVWWRGLRSGGNNHTVLAVGQTGAGNGLTMRYPAALTIQDDGAPLLWGHDDQGASGYLGNGRTLPAGQWHLLELFAGGLGAPAGERAAWADGVAVGRQTALFSGTFVDSWAEGVLPIRTESPYTGQDWFDDARTSSWIQPSHFAMKLNASAPGCDSYDVYAVTSELKQEVVPETADVSLDAGSTAVIYLAGSCTGSPPAEARVRIASGTSSLPVWVHQISSTLSLSTGSPDYLPWTAQIGPGTALVFHGLPKVVVAGTGYPFGVEVADDSGATVTAYTGGVGILTAATSTIPQVSPGSHPYVAADQGYFTFSPGVGFVDAGVAALTADAGTLTGTTGPVRVLGGGQLGIINDANLSAVVGQPYVYNAFGAITAVSTAGAAQFQECGAPSGFAVQQESGKVTWTPSAPGNFPVCLRASAG